MIYLAILIAICVVTVALYAHFVMRVPSWRAEAQRFIDYDLFANDSAPPLLFMVEGALCSESMEELAKAIEEWRGPARFNRAVELKWWNNEVDKILNGDPSADDGIVRTYTGVMTRCETKEGLR
jgi:hypothetical protein